MLLQDKASLDHSSSEGYMLPLNFLIQYWLITPTPVMLQSWVTRRCGFYSHHTTAGLQYRFCEITLSTCFGKQNDIFLQVLNSWKCSNLNFVVASYWLFWLFWLLSIGSLFLDNKTFFWCQCIMLSQDYISTWFCYWYVYIGLNVQERKCGSIWLTGLAFSFCSE